MYGWKLANKLKFGRSSNKDDKERENGGGNMSDAGKIKENTHNGGSREKGSSESMKDSGLKTGFFTHLGRGLSSNGHGSSNSTSNGCGNSFSPDSLQSNTTLSHNKRHSTQSNRDSVISSTSNCSKDRKATIIATPGSMAPVRLSTEVSTTISTAAGSGLEVNNSSAHSSYRELYSDTTDVADEDREKEQRQNLTQQQSQSARQQPRSDGAAESQKSEHTVNSSGIMTIKVYSGESFKLPISIASNQQILSKLLSSGVNTNTSRNGNKGVDELISSMQQITLREDDDDLISGDLATNYIPASIMLPDSEGPSSLIYLTIEFDNTVATIDPESGTIKYPVFNKISTFDVTRRLPYLKVDVFARIPSILLPSKAWQQIHSNNDPDVRELLEKINRNNDIHLDSFQLPLNLQFNSAASVRLYNHQWLNLEKGLGRINITIDYKSSKNKPLSIDDFDLLKVIGKGSFGKVMQVKKKDTNKVYALKAIRKSYIVSKSEVTHTLAERTVLARVDNPFIVPLKFSFQSPEKLYLVLAFINGGELFFHLQKEGRFDLSRARFYTAELLCALETLHGLNVIYRDLKPENILLDYQGHIALCDFGLCKLNMKDQDKTNTFCGTPEYLAPELLLGQGYSKVVDWWTLGVLLYEMLTGLPPYYDEDVSNMYRKILKEPLRFPDGFDKDAKDLLIGLLNRDPKRRLGYNGAEEIKRHAFFSQLSWKRLWMKGYIPPYKPPVMGAMDTSNFDQEFTREKPVDSVVNDFLSESVQQQFGGWTYVGSEQLGSSLVPGRSIR